MPGLEPVPEDWSRALAVVAHPDDMEYGTASAVARWTGQGKEVTYVMVTDGEAGIDGMAPDRGGTAAPRRGAPLRGRGRRVDTVEFLGHPDGLVQADLRLRARPGAR